MPDYIKFPFVLVVITLISAVSLTALQSVTAPAQAKIEAKAKSRALKVVLPTAVEFKNENTEVDGLKFSYLKGTDADGKLVGYVAEDGAPGYSSILKVMVGVDTEYKIIAIKVLSQKETPGLGDKVNEVLSKKTLVGMATGKKYDEKGLRPWFQIQFDGKLAPVKVQKDGGDIEAITGATISSRAVCDAVNGAVKKIQLATKK